MCNLINCINPQVSFEGRGGQMTGSCIAQEWSLQRHCTGG
ncbi:hypothetical protein ABBQ38_007344 [Trebouxia sp. C0009 RCD-2024]